MSSISSVGGTSSMMMQGMNRPQRPDPSKMAEDLFAKLDSSGKGYIEESDLASAFQSLQSGSGSGSTSSTDSASDVFSALDANSDGKVTKDEMTSGMQKLSDALESQFQSMRMNGGMGGVGGMPPPPENDAGFTKDELQSQLDDIGSSDSKRASLISNVINNFDKADTDGDGKVSFKEAMAYDQSTNSGSVSSTSGTTSTDTSSGSASGTDTTDAKLMLQIMRLMESYGLAGRQDSASAISVSA